MTPYLLRLDAEDSRNRRTLEQHYKKLHGRPVPFADIVRKLLKEGAEEVRTEKAKMNTVVKLMAQSLERFATAEADEATKILFSDGIGCLGGAAAVKKKQGGR